MPSVLSRLPDPSVASHIFAPTDRNPALSSMTAGAALGKALAIQWITEQEDDALRRVLRNCWHDAGDVRRLLAALCEQLATSTSQALSPAISASMPLSPKVPSRGLPFGEHFDFLSLPIVEGMSFDVDDFVEH